MLLLRRRRQRRRVEVRVRMLLLQLLLLLLLTTTSMMMMVMTCPRTAGVLARAAGVLVKPSRRRGPLGCTLTLALDLARMRRAMAAAAGRRTERLHARIRRAMAAAMA